MVTDTSEPLGWAEAVSAFRLPAQADRRLQQLMDRNNEGELSGDERQELEALVDMSENLSLVRARAFELLKRRPKC